MVQIGEQPMVQQQMVQQPARQMLVDSPIQVAVEQPRQTAPQIARSN